MRNAEIGIPHRIYEFINLERKSFVSLLCGSLKIRSGLPCSQMTPSFMKTTWEEMSLAKAISCVTTIMVIPDAARSLTDRIWKEATHRLRRKRLNR